MTSPWMDASLSKVGKVKRARLNKQDFFLRLIRASSARSFWSHSSKMEFSDSKRVHLAEPRTFHFIQGNRFRTRSCCLIASSNSLYCVLLGASCGLRAVRRVWASRPATGDTELNTRLNSFAHTWTKRTFNPVCELDWSLDKNRDWDVRTWIYADFGNQNQTCARHITIPTLEPKYLYKRWLIPHQHHE